MLVFWDRLGQQLELAPIPGDTVASLLFRHRIPVSSTIVSCEGQPITDATVVDPNVRYEAHLIEGYDILAILDTLAQVNKSQAVDAVYIKSILELGERGAITVAQQPLSLEQVADYVERTVADTCREFRLVEGGDKVLLGLSGGVDSGSLLLALSQARPMLPSFELAAVTFEDFDSSKSPAFGQAKELAAASGVRHFIAPGTLAQDTFHLSRPLVEILPALMKTESAHLVMYLDHHTTRRTLEVFAEQHGFNKIALGLHTTDLIAGLLNGFTTGYVTADLPLRRVGAQTYIYPLSFVHKRELHLYQLERMDRLSRHTLPNAWERNPLDRNFYYYLADILQAFWPGLEAMLFMAHSQRLSRQPSLKFEYCPNCGSALLHQPFTIAPGTECDACMIFRRHGYID